MELLLSIFIAIALSFLVAKLVSAILAPDNDVAQAKLADSKMILMEELTLKSAEGRQIERRVEVIQGEVKEVDRFEANESEVIGLSVEPSSSSSVEGEQELEASRSAVLERESESFREMNISTGSDALAAKEEAVEERDDNCGDQKIEVDDVTRHFSVQQSGSLRWEEENQTSGGDEQNGDGNEEIGAVGCEEENRQSGVDGNKEIAVAGCEEEEDQKNERNDEIGVVRCEVENQQSNEIGVMMCEKEDQKSRGGDEIGVMRCEKEDQKSRGSDEIGVVRCEGENQQSGGSNEIGVVRCEGENQQSGVSDEVGVVRCEEENQKSGVSDAIKVVRCEEEKQKSGGSDAIEVVRCEEENQKRGGSDAIEVVSCEEENQKSGGRDAIEVVSCEESLDGGRHRVEEEVEVVGYDDDWEGIERSELEKVFAVAAKYVASADHSDELAGLWSDIEMELYGLYKVATEGPCHESQPMALRVSARANWNAWQRLGSMNPDVAMERYVALLSEKIPGWMKDNYAGDSNRDVSQEGTTSTQDPKLSIFPRHEPNLTIERKPERKFVVEGDHLSETSHVVEKVKE